MTEARHALVTGGSRGIGAAIVKRLAAGGHHVSFTYVRDEASAERVAQDVRSAGGVAHARQADLTDLGSVERLVASIGRAELPYLDIVVNNAAVLTELASIEDTPLSAWSDHLMISATAPFLIIKHATPHLRPGASIINVSTINTSSRPAAGVAAYVAGKGALEQLTVIAALELGPRDVTVNAVRPGLTDTDMQRAANPDPAMRAQVAEATPLRRLGQPDDIADVVEFLAGPQARWVTGQIITASGGL